MLHSKVFEIHVFKKCSKSKFLLLQIEKLWMELISYKKSCWLVLKSCSMLWRWFVMSMRPPLVSLATGGRWIYSNAAVMNLALMGNRNTFEFSPYLKKCTWTPLENHNSLLVRLRVKGIYYSRVIKGWVTWSSYQICQFLFAKAGRIVLLSLINCKLYDFFRKRNAHHTWLL